MDKIWPNQILKVVSKKMWCARGWERLSNVSHSHPFCAFLRNFQYFFSCKIWQTLSSKPEQTIITPLDKRTQKELEHHFWKLPELLKKSCSNKNKYLKVLPRIFRVKMKTLDKAPWQDNVWNYIAEEDVRCFEKDALNISAKHI